MSKTYNTTGIVLRRGDYRENDRLFVILTKEFGKIDVVARGTKKILSKLNPHLEPLNHVKLMVAKGRGFDKLGNAIAVKDFQGLKSKDNLAVWPVANYIVEVTEKILHSNYNDPVVYEMLHDALSFFEEAASDDMTLTDSFFIAQIYIAKLLDHLGYRPDLSRCIECHKGMVFPKSTYDFSRGGLVCENCKSITLLYDHYDISDSVIKILNTTLLENFQTLDNFKFQCDDKKEFSFIVSKLIEYQLERKINSLAYLDVIKSLT